MTLSDNWLSALEEQRELGKEIEAEKLAGDMFEILSSEDDEERGDPTDYLEHHGGAACAVIFRRAADALESGELAVSYQEDYGYWTAGRTAEVVVP